MTYPEDRFPKIMVCTLIKGCSLDNKWCYMYVAMHIDEFNKFIENLRGKGTVNPKDYNVTVLARYYGEPTNEVREFMLRKFAFGETKVILQIESEHIDELDISPIADKSLALATKPFSPLGEIIAEVNTSLFKVEDKDENNFPIKDVYYMRIGSGYIHPSEDYSFDFDIFQQYVNHVNEYYDTDTHKNVIEKECMKED